MTKKKYTVQQALPRHQAIIHEEVNSFLAIGNDSVKSRILPCIDSPPWSDYADIMVDTLVQEAISGNTFKRKLDACTAIREIRYHTKMLYKEYMRKILEKKESK